MRSSLSVPLPYQGSLHRRPEQLLDPAGRLRLARSRSGRALEVAEVIAVAVANADAHAQLGEQARNMRLAMESRAVIEQAKGVLMAQRHVDADQAFEILREASQRYNRKLRDIAAGHRGVHPGHPAPLTDPARSADGRDAARRETRNSTAAALSTVSATSTAVRAADTVRRSTRVCPRPSAQAGVDDDVAAHGAQRARARSPR